MTDQTLINVHIRWMVRHDLPEVLDIEKTSFDFPWTEDDFIHHFTRWNSPIGEVARHNEKIVGYMVYELHRNHLNVLNFAVCPDVRRRGVGRQMIEKLIGKLLLERRDRILFEVRETNLDAQVFLRSLGFVATDILHDHYDEITEDAYVMSFRHGWETETTTKTKHKFNGE